ncbi:ABC transporter substrate-binding protein [Xanthomonas translucens pv. graminis]|uniref:ABC transporter substrate-binding protein n=1 Tax=Xanthomonas graminis TaxID=3390026 RepID=UPI0025413D44|nr:ABC transporter substrate-binding protein [Xanthomonas translucens]WIH04219.1 ABC transporter substrate-binding protein [Xanthomonas translucens pv. graminis]
MTSLRSLRAALLVLGCILFHDAQAAPGDIRRFPAQGVAEAQLCIQGSTDIEVFAAVIGDYQRLHPRTEVVYQDVIAWDMYQRYLHPLPGARCADLLISASMDLQTKLVNDGHALAHRSPQTEALPAWAQWRHEAFGISYEPVAIVYNKARLPAAQVPHTRRQLLELLRAPGLPLRGRIGTYDVERSGVGYLFATQDGQIGSMSGALLAAMGDNQVVLEERTGVLLDRVSRGELLLAYNVLGSYAQARIDAGAPLAIVQPEDYTLVALRTAVIPRDTPHAAEARRFLDYLLSPRGQQVLSREAQLKPILPMPGGGAAPAAPPSFRPIALGPGLLVYLDALKRRQFLDAWRSSMRRHPPRQRVSAVPK